jgi:hypothetical protein
MTKSATIADSAIFYTENQVILYTPETTFQELPLFFTPKSLDLD